jgi:hypothetical protein
MTVAEKDTREFSNKDSFVYFLKYSASQLRLVDYFYGEDVEWILPITIFPLFSFNKNKMELSYQPHVLTPELEKELREIITKYLVRLDVHSIHVPRSDCLGKIGNQRFNDLGEIKFDYERGSITDISFVYQNFMTKNLSPREVWVPSKIIKYNNLFLMKVYRQLLSKDKAYPPEDVNDVRDQIYKDEGPGNFYHFDLPGYGFQYPRSILRVGQEVIEELYPCTELSEQSSLFYKILEETKVRLPSGRIDRPPRGIGLGYYEDLKTLIILAILWNKFTPVSLYGDQGLMRTDSPLFREELMRFGFLFKEGIINIVDDCFRSHYNWAGYRFPASGPVLKPTSISTDLIESFFSDEHWERKNSLRSLSMRRPNLYKSHFSTIALFYKRIYGFEFHNSEFLDHFDNGGLNYRDRLVGVTKLYNLRSMMTPKSELEIDVGFSSSFLNSRRRRPPTKDSRIFSSKRKDLFKKNKPNDSVLYDYIYPLLEYNNKMIRSPPVIPRWADYQQILMHGITSGSFTCGLTGEEVKLASRQHFSPDPFRARATGGYSFKTQYRSSRPASAELVEMSEYLSELVSVTEFRVNRADLHQTPYLSDDPMYYDTNLHVSLEPSSSKRKVDEVVDELAESSHVLETFKKLKGILEKSKAYSMPSSFIVDKEIFQHIQELDPLDTEDFVGGFEDDHLLLDEYGDPSHFAEPDYV